VIDFEYAYRLLGSRLLALWVDHVAYPANMYHHLSFVWDDFVFPVELFLCACRLYTAHTSLDCIVAVDPILYYQNVPSAFAFGTQAHCIDNNLKLHSLLNL